MLRLLFGYNRWRNSIPQKGGRRNEPRRIGLPPGGGRERRTGRGGFPGPPLGTDGRRAAAKSAVTAARPADAGVYGIPLLRRRSTWQPVFVCQRAGLPPGGTAAAGRSLCPAGTGFPRLSLSRVCRHIALPGSLCLRLRRSGRGGAERAAADALLGQLCLLRGGRHRSAAGGRKRAGRLHWVRPLPRRLPRRRAAQRQAGGGPVPFRADPAPGQTGALAARIGDTGGIGLGL